MLNLKVRELKAEDVKFRLEILEEEEGPEGHFDSGDEEEDRKTVNLIKLKLRRGDLWAWCTVEVVATWNNYSGRTLLGACSYDSEEDFKAEGGYYQQMCEEALDDLNHRIASNFENIAPLVTVEYTGSTE